MPDTDSYCTPAWLAARLGQFDFDPCSNPRSHIDALDFASLENGDDGLLLPWNGKIWLNHPYSNPMPWMQKLHQERIAGRCKESMVLAKLDPSTKWWKYLTDPELGPCDLWVFDKRLQFDCPPGIKPSSNNFCSVLVHHGELELEFGAPRYYKPPQLDLSDVATLWRLA